MKNQSNTLERQRKLYRVLTLILCIQFFVFFTLGCLTNNDVFLYISFAVTFVIAVFIGIIHLTTKYDEI